MSSNYLEDLLEAGTTPTGVGVRLEFDFNTSSMFYGYTLRAITPCCSDYPAWGRRGIRASCSCRRCGSRLSVPEISTYAFLSSPKETLKTWVAGWTGYDESNITIDIDNL